jgi:geranylgeranyl pyrophosphate synthase
LRRGDDCIHIKYGVDIATNTGNFMYYAPMQKLSTYVPAMRLRDKINKVYHEEMFHILIGQNCDINWHQGKVKPNEQQYY